MARNRRKHLTPRGIPCVRGLIKPVCVCLSQQEDADISGRFIFIMHVCNEVYVFESHLLGRGLWPVGVKSVVITIKVS